MPISAITSLFLASRVLSSSRDTAIQWNAFVNEMQLWTEKMS